MFDRVRNTHLASITLFLPVCNTSAPFRLNIFQTNGPVYFNAFQDSVVVTMNFNENLLEISLLLKTSYLQSQSFLVRTRKTDLRLLDLTSYFLTVNQAQNVLMFLLEICIICFAHFVYHF